MPDIRLTFRYVGIRTEEGELPGLCLACDDADSAKQVFGVLHDYFVAPSRRKFVSIRFAVEEAGTYELAVSVVGGTAQFHGVVSGVDATHVASISEGLRRFPGYVLLVGYEEGGQFHILPPRQLLFVKRDLVINGRPVVATGQGRIDWQELLRRWT